MRALLSFRLHLLTNDRVLYEKKPVIYLRAPERGPRRYFPARNKRRRSINPTWSCGLVFGQLGSKVLAPSGNR
jgi:hypothetical protein